MEANLVPGMTYGSSYFPEACGIAHELAYDKVIELMLEDGLARASSTLPIHIQSGSDNTFVAAISKSLSLLVIRSDEVRLRP